MKFNPFKKKEVASIKKDSLLTRLKHGLDKTRHQLTDGLSAITFGKKTIDDEILEEIETVLLTSDLGISVTQQFIKDLVSNLNRKALKDGQSVMERLREDMTKLLQAVEKPLDIQNKKPFVLLMFGINGSGKTTTIGKLAKRFQAENKSVLLAAGDTFRAAAIDQLKVWGERNNIPVIAQKPGSDSASVIFDAITAAQARNIDIVIADTAGRLHTQDNLMAELKKIERVIKKADPTAPHESMLVIDANIGQNALQQAKEFHAAVPISGLVMTKLDGTAKGGIIFAIAKELALPIRFIGIGEKIDDLQPFSAKQFVDALFSQ